MKIRYLFFVVLLLASISSHAQWECRSHLAANLKPVFDGANLKWGAELVGSEGYLTNSNIASGMAFLGLDYSIGNHQFYVEGGFKHWNSNNYDSDYQFSKSRLGLRDLSYSYTNPVFDFRLGLHQLDAADYFLVNERAWGTSISKAFGDTKFNFELASVTKDFARNGIFCTNGYLYDIVESRSLALGNNLGDTNFASFSIEKKFSGKKSKSQSSVDEDGFEEFAPVDDSSSSTTRFLKSVGAIVYSEFGNDYSKPQWYGGLFAEANCGNVLGLKAEGIYQQITDNSAFIWYLQAEKTKEWKSGNYSTLQFLYLTKYDVNEDASVMLHFSNLFLGEVFRMDAIDMPLVNLSAKHQFTNQQLSLKLQYTKQLQNEKMEELDFSAGKFFLNKHMRLTALTGLMKSEELDDWSKLARLEMRFYF